MTSLSESAATHYGDIRSYLETNGNIIGSMDLLIAAHAGSLFAPLKQTTSENTKEFLDYVQRIESDRSAADF
jgi:tRNA(fMet)-specific endonuclease VapC